MYFSNFVASKLNVWNSNGRHRLEEFLAKMGFSLEQCKQKYPFMSCQLRKRLRDQIEKYAEDYGLQDVFYGELFETFAVPQAENMQSSPNKNRATCRFVFYHSLNLHLRQPSFQDRISDIVGSKTR